MRGKGHLGHGIGTAVAVAALAVCAAPAVASPAPSASAAALTPKATAGQSALLRMSVNPRKSKFRYRVPPNFTGFSVEYNQVPRMTGTFFSGPNPATVGLLKNIAAANSGAPVIRVGGLTSDNAWWNPNLGPRPAGITYDITADYLARLKILSASAHSKVIIGLNLLNNLKTARDWMVVSKRSLGKRVLAYELGNEPDIYGQREYYPTPSGPYRVARPGYTFGNYLYEFRKRAIGLRRAVKNPPLAGPVVIGGSQAFLLNGVAPFLKREHKRVKLLTYHYYAGLNCPGVKPGDYSYMTLKRMLSNPISNRPVGNFLTLVGNAKRYRKGVRITETNSMACGGKAGVSDTMGSALWAIDYMAKMVVVGVRGTDFHTGGTNYSPFFFNWTPDEGWTGYVAPVYYGMLFFARTVANRATILLDASIGARVRKGANVVSYATVDRRRTVRVAIVNKDFKQSGVARIRIRGALGQGKLSRLVAAGGIRAKSGVAIAGQEVAVATKDGKLRGAPRTELVSRRGGTYNFNMPAGTAAMLEVKIRR